MDWRPRLLALLFCSLFVLPPLASAEKKTGPRAKPRAARQVPVKPAKPGKPKEAKKVKPGGRPKQAAKAGGAAKSRHASKGTVKAARGGALKQEHRLATTRDRLRAGAGVRAVPARDADLPMVAITVLPGDDHARLSRDLTGSFQSEAVLRTIEPELTPGEKIFVPRAILSAGLSDPAHEEIRFGDRYPSLYSVARELTEAERNELPTVVRNLQRLNGILDPSKMHRGQTVLVPKSLIAVARSTKPEEAPAAAPEKVPQPKLAISRQYLVTDVQGLHRTSSHVPARLREALGAGSSTAGGTDRGNVDLVVLHTTEHSASTFENTAAYIQRKRLANYIIGPDGTAYEVVPEQYRAFGCGDSLWEGRYTVDLEAINIEIFANTAPGPRAGDISDAQYEGLKALLADIRARRPAIHEGRIVTHRMVALSYKLGTRSRKGDPYIFHWAKVGLPDNSQVIDQDVLLGRAKLCTDGRYSDRVTAGQTAAARALHAL